MLTERFKQTMHVPVHVYKDQICIVKITLAAM